MRRGQHLLVAALALSALLHALALGNLDAWWTAPAPEIAFPIEASLVTPPPVEAPPPAPIPPARPAPAPVAKPAIPIPPPPMDTPPQPGTSEASAPAVDLHPATTSPPPELEPGAPPTLPAPEPESVATQPAPLPPPALRGLPERLSLRYAVQAGEDGFTLGKTVYTWLARNGRYSLVSVTEATGITSLFMSGRIVQTSEGLIAAHGLQPEQFWIARGERRQPPVRFDWGQKSLILPAGGVDLPMSAQDQLSFPFHLAMTASEREDAWPLYVTNGKKLREYTFRALGRETVNQLDVLHLQGTRPGEGSLDVWLAPARHWLPVRIRTLDQKGKAMVLSLEAVE